MMDPIKVMDISHSKKKRLALFSDGVGGKDDPLVSAYQNRILADLSRCDIEAKPVFDRDAAFIILFLSVHSEKQSADELIKSRFIFYDKKCVSPECLGVLNEGDKVKRVGVSCGDALYIIYLFEHIHVSTIFIEIFRPRSSFE